MTFPRKVMMDLPIDLLRIIVREIPDAKGFHSFALSNRRFSQLCREVREIAKTKYAKELRYEHDKFHDRFVVEHRLPGGILHGPHKIYKGVNIIYHVTYVDGRKEGPIHEWYSDGRLRMSGHCHNDKLDGIIYRWDHGTSERSVCDDGFILLKEVWYSNGALFHRRINYWGWSGQRRKEYSYDRNGRITVANEHDSFFGTILRESYDNQGLLINRERYPSLKRGLCLLTVLFGPFIGFIGIHYIFAK